MANLEYSLSELHTLFELGLRKSMYLNEKSEMYDVAVRNKDSILKHGNPVLNKLYKNMKVSVLDDHLNLASTENVVKTIDTEGYDILIDDGHIESLHDAISNTFSPYKLITPYSSRNNLSKYQPYFEPTGRISDFATAHSIGTVGVSFSANKKNSTSIAYHDFYQDNDLNCVSVIIDIGKNSIVNIDETFLNKDGLKIYKIIYLIRDFATLNLTRNQDNNSKDTGANIIESNVIQFPNSKFNYKVSGEGNKYNQDLMYIDVYKNCKTDITGMFDLYGNYINNVLVDVHHIGPDSTSRINVKSIIDDTSHSSFLGSITVDKDAINTDAQLVNKNLLLSSKATAITEPQLDINTKEIACSHGCTVSNINEDQLYLLESRGIETNIAEETLKQCFLVT